MSIKSAALARPRSLSIYETDWHELKAIAEAALGPGGRPSDGLRILMQRHREAVPRTAKADTAA
jgi:hypothetical protein